MWCGSSVTTLRIVSKKIKKGRMDTIIAGGKKNISKHRTSKKRGNKKLMRKLL
jgi:acetyl-CoA acetyltransferase